MRKKVALFALIGVGIYAVREAFRRPTRVEYDPAVAEKFLNSITAGGSDPAFIYCAGVMGRQVSEQSIIVDRLTG